MPMYNASVARIEEEKERTGDAMTKEKNDVPRSSRRRLIAILLFTRFLMVVYPTNPKTRKGKHPLLRRLASSIPTYASKIYRKEKKTHPLRLVLAPR